MSGGLDVSENHEGEGLGFNLCVAPSLQNPGVLISEDEGNRREEVSGKQIVFS